MNDVNIRNQYINKGRKSLKSELKDTWDMCVTKMYTYNIGTIIDFLWLLDCIDDIEVIRNNIRCQKKYLDDEIIAYIILFSRNADIFIEALKLEKSEDDRYDLESEIVLENINKKQLIGFNDFLNNMNENENTSIYKLTLDNCGNENIINVIVDENNYIKGTIDYNNLVLGKIIDNNHVFLYIITKYYVMKYYGTLNDNILNLKDINNNVYVSYKFEKLELDTNITFNLNRRVNCLITKLPYDLVSQLVEDSEAIINLISNKIVK